MFRPPVTLFGEVMDHSEPEALILFDAATPQVHGGKVQLSHSRTRACGPRKPVRCLHRIGANPHTREIEVSKLNLCFRVTLVGSLVIPVGRLLQVSGNSPAHEVITRQLQFFLKSP